MYNGLLSTQKTVYWLPYLSIFCILAIIASFCVGPGMSMFFHVSLYTKAQVFLHWHYVNKLVVGDFTLPISDDCKGSKAVKGDSNTK